MNRRDAIVLLVGAGFTGRYVVAKAEKYQVSASTTTFDPNAPTDLMWELGRLRNFIVQRGNERVVIPADDVWKALRGDHADKATRPDPRATKRARE